MLYYNDKIPDVELCKLGKEFGENDIDANTTNTRNEYATKMLLLFFLFQDKVDFPNFEDRWIFSKIVRKGVAILGFRNVDAKYSRC